MLSTVEEASANWAVKVNVLPWLGSLSTQIFPFISSTSCDEIVSPRPVPPNLLVDELSAWENASKIQRCLFFGIPIPVSVMAKRKVALLVESSSNLIDSETQP